MNAALITASPMREVGRSAVILLSVPVVETVMIPVPFFGTLYAVQGNGIFAMVEVVEYPTALSLIRIIIVILTKVGARRAIRLTILLLLVINVMVLEVLLPLMRDRKIVLLLGLVTGLTKYVMMGVVIRVILLVIINLEEVVLWGRLVSLYHLLFVDQLIHVL